jgi:hypothetical protein
MFNGNLNGRLRNEIIRKKGQKFYENDNSQETGNKKKSN